MKQYFPKPHRNFGGNINVKVDLPNYARKADLPSLKVDIDKIDVGKLKTVRVVLRKLSNVVNNDVAQNICVW